MVKNLAIIDTYLKSYPHYSEFLAIVKDVFMLRQKTAPWHKENIFSLETAAAVERLSEGKSLVDISRDTFNPVLPRQYFLDLLKITKQPPAEDLRDKLLTGELNYETLVRESSTAYRATHITGEEDDEVYDLLDFLLQESMHPFFALLSEEFKGLVANSEWSRGRCPVCGRETALSFLSSEEEGRRYLFCSQCGLEWPVKRLKCPFCGNEEQKQLGFFTVGDDEKYRVDFCHQCKKYIKTIDTRKISGEVDLEVENLITLHLDILARQEGYF